jgi:catechol 2,3-dioxygenase-like lactoylglutathione lyase family enzyme
MSANQAKVHITGVRTVGVPVTDQDRALEFYVGKLGFAKGIDMAFGPGERWVEVMPPGSPTSIALVRAHDGAPAGIDTQVRLTTDSAADAHAELKARGVDVDAEILLYPVPMFAFRDQDGNRLVIVEAPKSQVR